MKSSSLTLTAPLIAGVIVVVSVHLAAHAQVTVQRPSNVVGTGSNAWNYLVVEGESYLADSEADADPTTGFGQVYNDEALMDAYGYPILPTNSTASMQGALGTLGPATFGRFADKVTYQMVFSTPGDYYMYMRFTMFDNNANNTYLNEDSFFTPPGFNLDPQNDWPIPGTSSADTGGYTEGCCSSRGFLFILDYQGDGSRTDHSTDTNYWEGNFHWNQLFVSQFLSTIHTNEDGTPRQGNAIHYVVTPAMVGVPQNFTIAYRERGVTVDAFLFSTHSNLMNDFTQNQLDELLIKKIAVQDAGNVVPTSSNAWSFLVMESENFVAKSNRNLTLGFAAVAPGSTNIDSYGTTILATNTTASGKGALYTQSPSFGRFSDKIVYQVQFATPGDYYMYMRFTMFENSAGGGNGSYLNEDSFFTPPGFNLDSQNDWPIPGTSGADTGGYTEGCCSSRGFLFILDYQGDGSRTDHSTDTNYWEGNFHWNQLFVSQFLSTIHTNEDGSPRQGNAIHYVVTPAMVGVPQNFQIAYREPGVTPDLFLFSTHTNLLNDYTQEELDQLILHPKLGIVRSGASVVLSWPGAASGFVLESTSSLTSPSWTAVMDSAAIVGSQYNLTVAPAGTKYYRLRQR
jgi:hypothetical protein